MFRLQVVSDGRVKDNLNGKGHFHSISIVEDRIEAPQDDDFTPMVI